MATRACAVPAPKAENNAPDSPPDIRRRMRVYPDRL